MFDHFWHLLPETFSSKSELSKNVVVQKSYDRKCALRSAFSRNFSFKITLSHSGGQVIGHCFPDIVL